MMSKLDLQKEVFKENLRFLAKLRLWKNENFFYYNFPNSRFSSANNFSYSGFRMQFWFFLIYKQAYCAIVQVLLKRFVISKTLKE